ncbi:MAG: hypothetical protein ACP5O4_00500 [bacterium]
MKKLIITLLIAMIAITSYIISPIEPNIAIAGIKKGAEKPQFSYTQNVKLPDFHYNTIVSITNSITTTEYQRAIIVMGGHFDPYKTDYRYEGRRYNGTTSREIGLNVYQNVLVGSINEGDVIINQYQDKYQHLIEQTNYYTDVYSYVLVVDPIVVDLDSNGVPDVAKGINTPHNFFDKSRAKLFDINADGVKDLMEWIGPNDGLLIFFKNDKYTEEVDGFNLMSNAFGFANGFEKLFEMFDANKDRVIDKSEMSQLYVWQDKNQDAKVQKDELITLEKLGVSKIVLSYGQDKMESVMYKEDGSIIKTWQWWPSVHWGIGNK